MSEQRTSRERPTARRAFLAATGTASAALAGCTSGSLLGASDPSGTSESQGGSGGASGRATIFHAGSLAGPFAAVEESFEAETGVRVDRETKGSVGSTKKITEQGRSADVLGVSDFRLIRDMMLGEYADWYGIFVTNAMAIAHTEESAYADEFSKDNWWEVLSREDVTVAHSDPAVDPNGYRAVMAMQLGAIEFEGETLYDEATAEALVANAEVTSDTETGLVGQLESGALDYAWEYRSAGATHDNLTVVGLQPQVNLAEATTPYAEHYSKAEVEADGNRYTGAPIAYGITVPSVAENPEAGVRWVEYVSTGPGAEIMRESGFSAVSPMVVPERTSDAVPDAVMDGSTARESLGPLEL